MRLQVLVAPDGQCIHYGGTINGRRHDFVLFEQSGLVNEMVKMVVQSDGTRIPTRPVILADGGYRGITVAYPEAVIPRRRLPPSQLSEEDQCFNTALSHDRITVERFFGRLKGYWGILQKPTRLDKINIDGLLRICVCLTNLKLQRAPLFASERIYDPDPEYEEDDSFTYSESEDGIGDEGETAESSPKKSQASERVGERKESAVLPRTRSVRNTRQVNKKGKRNPLKE